MATIKIPTPLRPFTDNQAVVTVEGDTVQNALNHLVQQYPELEQHIFQDGVLRNFVNVFLDDEDVRFLQGAQTEIDDAASLRIIPSIAGGSH